MAVATEIHQAELFSEPNILQSVTNYHVSTMLANKNKFRFQSAFSSEPLNLSIRRASGTLR